METFLDEIFMECAQKQEYEQYLGIHFTIEPEGQDEITPADGFTISDIHFQVN